MVTNVVVHEGNYFEIDKTKQLKQIRFKDLGRIGLDKKKFVSIKIFRLTF